MIGVKKVVGGTLRESFLVQGVAFKKTFSYAGFEQQPKSFDNPKILLLNVELPPTHQGGGPHRDLNREARTRTCNSPGTAHRGKPSQSPQPKP